MMLRDVFNIQSRDELITFSGKIGEVLRQNNRGRPWCIDLHGDSESGKSLIAIGIDHAFNPHAYPNGITTDIKADRLPSTKIKPSEEIYFYNFAHRLEETRESYDKLLTRIEFCNPDAKVLIFGNVMRLFAHDLSNDMNSDRLDIALDVRQYPKNSPRQVTLRTRDPAFLEAWASHQPLLNERYI